jgi:hypothetical protein
MKQPQLVSIIVVEPDPDPGGQKCPRKMENSYRYLLLVILEVLDVLF